MRQNPSRASVQFNDVKNNSNSAGGSSAYATLAPAMNGAGAAASVFSPSVGLLPASSSFSSSPFMALTSASHNNNNNNNNSGKSNLNNGTGSSSSNNNNSNNNNVRRQLIGKYELGQVLAVGDFDCWTRLCTHVVTGAQYVVRTYRKDVLREVAWMWDRVHDSIHVQRFLPKHEGIVEMVECFETESAVYILMQLFPSLNTTRLYTTRQLSAVAPFLAENMKHSPGQPHAITFGTATAEGKGHGGGGGREDARGASPAVGHPLERSANPSASPTVQPHVEKRKRQGIRRHKPSHSRSPPPQTRGLPIMRTPPLEHLDIRYTSPLVVGHLSPEQSPGSGRAAAAAGVLAATDALSLCSSDLSSRADDSESDREDAAQDRRRTDGPARRTQKQPADLVESDSDEDDDDDDESADMASSGGLNQQKVPLDTTRKLFVQVVRAVQHMHRHSVVHLGLAPDHVMVNERGVAKVGNLISCRPCTPGETIRELRGTRHTVAPEVLRGDAYDPFLADSWSLGVLLYFMLNDGRYPHDGANTLQHVLYQHIRAPNPAIPPTAKDLLSRLLQMNPGNRLSVDGIVMHPFCVGVWQEIEEESHRKTESNSQAMAAAAAAAVAAVAVARGSVDGSFGEENDDTDGTNNKNTDDARGAGAGGGLLPASSAPVLAASPLVIAATRLLSEPQRRLSFLDDNNDVGAGRGGGAAPSAFARTRGVFLRATGTSAHIWGQGQGMYGQDIGASGGLLFQLQPSAVVTGGGVGAALSHYGPSAGGANGGTTVVRVSGGREGSREPGRSSSEGEGASSGWRDARRIHSISAGVLLAGGRTSAVMSQWDPVQEAFSIDLPPGLTRESEAAYVIQHTFRAYLQRRRYRRATRRLNRIGWHVFESLYATPPPPPLMADDAQDSEAGDRVWPGRRRYSRNGGGDWSRAGRQRRTSQRHGTDPLDRRGTARDGRGRPPATRNHARALSSSVGVPPSPFAQAARQQRLSRTPGGLQRSVLDNGSPLATHMAPATTRGRPNGADDESAAVTHGSANPAYYELFSIQSSTPDSSKPPSRSGSASYLAVTPHGGGGGGGGGGVFPRRPTLLPATSAAPRSFYEEDDVPGGGGGGGDSYRSRYADDNEGSYLSEVYSTAVTSGGGGGGAGARGAAPRWSQSRAGSYYGTRHSQQHGSFEGRLPSSPSAASRAQQSSLPRLYSAASLGQAVGLSRHPSAVAMSAVALKAGDGQMLPVVSAKEDCPLCHRPAPLAKKINVTPYALTHYAYKNGEFELNPR